MNLNSDEISTIERALAIVARMKAEKRPKFAGGGEADDGGGENESNGDQQGQSQGENASETPGGGSFGGGLADRSSAAEAAPGPSTSAADALGGAGYGDIGSPSDRGVGFGDFGAAPASDTVGGLGAPSGLGSIDSGVDTPGRSGFSGLSAIGVGLDGVAGFDNFGGVLGAGVGPSLTSGGYSPSPGYSDIAPGDRDLSPMGGMTVPGGLGRSGPGVGADVGDMPSANPGRGGWAAPGATSDAGPWGSPPAASYSNAITQSHSPGAVMGTLDAVQSAIPGATVSGVAGLLGNFAGRESPSSTAPQGINWGAYNPNDVGQPAFGAAQHRAAYDRATGLAKALGFDSYTDPGFVEALATAKNAQLGYMGSEITGGRGYGATLAAMTNPALSPDQVAEVVTSNYEKPAKSAAAKAKGSVEQAALNAYNNIVANQAAYSDAAAAAPAPGSVPGGMNYNATGLGVFSGPTPGAPAAVASNFSGPPAAAAPAAAQAAISNAIGVQTEPAGPYGALSPSQVEPPGAKIGGPLGTTARDALGSFASIGATPAGFDNFGAAPLADDPMGVGVTPGSKLGSVTTGPAGTGVAAFGGLSALGAKVDAVPGFDNFGVDIGAGMVPSIADKPDPSVEQVRGMPALAEKAAGRLGTAALSAAIPGLGLASLASGLLGGPTIGSLASMATKDKIGNARAADAIQSGYLGAMGGDGGRALSQANVARPAEIAAAPAVQQAAPSYGGKTPAQLAYEASIAARGAGAVPVSTPGRVVRTGLVRAAPPVSTYDRVMASLQNT